MINKKIIITGLVIFHIITFRFEETTAAQDTDMAETVVSLSAFVESKKVPLNRTLEFTVQISWMGDLDLIEINELEEPVLANFEIVGTSSANRVSGISGGKKAVKEISYRLQPTTLGMGYIESVVLSYKELKTGKTRHLRTQRIGAEAVSPVPDRGERGKLWLWIVLGFVGIFGFSVFFFYVKKRSRIDDGEEEIERIIEEAYLEELRETVDLKSADRREAFTILSKLFRRYLSEKYDISALEATTEELLKKIEQEGLDESLIRRCETLFSKADVVKFSGREAEQSEIEEAYTTVETILESHLAKLKERLLEEEERGKKRKKRRHHN